VSTYLTPERFSRGLTLNERPQEYAPRRGMGSSVTPVAYLETGVIECADNVQALSRLPDDCIDLVYLDPPFFSNRNYEVIWGDEAEVRSFEDRWEGGINVYLDWMEPRLRQLHRVLKATGSFYLHCDPHASHYLKVLLDEVFGQPRFRSEIIWKRSTAHSDTKQGRSQLGSIHDSILFYTKGDEWTWNPSFTPYDEAYVESKYRHVEPETGRRYRLDNLTGPGGASKGNPEYEVMGVRRHWRYSQARMAELIAAGRIVQTKPGTVPQFKRYLDEMPGVPLQDVWTDLAPINSRARERLGYPTQKPEALLERIIRLSSNPGQIVLDPFCGCGTTIAVAQKLGRQWIGFDISQQAIEINKLRLNKLGAAPKTLGLATSVDDLRKLGPFEFQHWIIQRVLGTPSPRNVSDMGIDGYSFFEQLPIQVKQSEHVGRNVIDNFETAVERAGKHRGYIVAFSFTKGAREEVARAKREGRPEIVLVTVADLVRVGDLIDSADRDGRPPRLDSVTPDLMGLFSALQQPVQLRPFYPAPPRDSKPSASQLIESARERRGQRSLPLA